MGAESTSVLFEKGGSVLPLGHLEIFVSIVVIREGNRKGRIKRQ